MAEYLISEGLLEVISNRLLEMEEVQGSRHFQISRAISADMEASQTGDVVNSSMTKTESR